MSDRLIVVFCGILMGAAAFSIDMMLPAFTAIADGLDAPYEKVQLIIPVFILTIGFFQVVMGVLSDRYGRKPILLLGLGFYTLGSVACTFAPNIDWLLLGRVVQGIGVSAAPAIARAILRDRSSGTDLARNLATASMIFALCPIIAPLVGAILMQFASWRILFGILVVFGFLLCIVAMVFLPETSTRRNIEATQLGNIASNAIRLFAHPVSRINLLISGILMICIMIMLTITPTVFEVNYGVTGPLFAILFAMHGFGIIIGQLINRKLISKVGILKSSTFGAIGQVIILSIIAAIAVVGLDGPYLVSFMLFLFAVFYLIVYANGTAMVLEHHGDIAGFAAAFYGFYSQVFSALVVMLLISFIGSDFQLYALSLLGVSFVVLAMLLWQLQRMKLTKPA